MLHGIAWLGPATAFPQAIGLSTTWQPELVSAVRSAVGDETRAFHRKDPSGAGSTCGRRWATRCATRSGRECVRHLAALGHREAALLGAPAVVYERTTGFARRTLAGFTEAARVEGLLATAEPREEDFEVARVGRRSGTGRHAARPETDRTGQHGAAARGTMRECSPRRHRRYPVPARRA